MKLTIKHQDTYSRGQLLLRSFFGVLYILIPHAFCFFFVGIWAAILMFLAWWVILFTAKFPRNWYEFMVGFYNWQARVNASLWNLVDDYPAFFPSGTSEAVKLEAPYPETLSRGLLLLRTFFGWLYVGLPHGICLWIRSIGSAILMFLAWWVVLFTGKYPENWHAFIVGTMRWSMRVTLYMANMTDEYPPFSGKE